MPRLLFVAILGSIFALCVALPRANAAPGDACSLLTPAQIKSATGADVNVGSAASAKLCQWNASSAANSSVKFITLLLYSDTKSFAAGKNMPAPAVVTSVSGIGDDAFFLAVADQVGLIVKKGSGMFKITVYAKLSIDQKESMEKALAMQIVSQL
jgi:hypothetical protein